MFASLMHPSCNHLVACTVTTLWDQVLTCLPRVLLLPLAQGQQHREQGNIPPLWCLDDS